MRTVSEWYGSGGIRTAVAESQHSQAAVSLRAPVWASVALHTVIPLPHMLWCWGARDPCRSLQPKVSRFQALAQNDQLRPLDQIEYTLYGPLQKPRARVPGSSPGAEKSKRSLST